MRFGLPQTAIDKICAVFALHPEVEQAVLYGSRAKGNYKNGSDIDLTLHGAQLSHRVLLTLLGELDDLLLPWMIDLSIFDTLDHPALKDHIERGGVTFYRRASLASLDAG
ncbi:MAG: polymerase beta subunit [Massilia sp.]|jgi:predicted nucleotidyltransferase|nr:polymerase beta subunit [Massilia sp.]